MRTIIDIPDEQVVTLAELCRRNAISRAEAIRCAIARYLRDEGHRPTEAFGMWKGRGIDGVDYQERLRAEWRE